MPQAAAKAASHIAIPKNELTRLLASLPDPMPVAELIHRLLLWQKWAVSDEDIATGRTFTQEEIEAQAASWGK